jgi:hypothetical protein
MPRGSNYRNLMQDKFPKFARYLVFKRFMKYVKIGKPNECWEWQGSLHPNGYGNFAWPEKRILFSHQAAYELFVGKRHKLEVCHECDNPVCWNPSHLWLGTSAQNMFDRNDKGRQRNAKLTLDSAEKIRKLHNSGKYSQYILAEKFNVHQSQISKVINMQQWKEREVS